MIDRENVIKGLEWILEGDRFGFGKGVTKPESDEEKAGCFIHDALSLLKENGWHMLTEDADGIIHGLPGDDGQYLMTDGKDIWIDDYVDGVDDGVLLDSGRDIREIKAWMYMPEPPKEGR